MPNSALVPGTDQRSSSPWHSDIYRDFTDDQPMKSCSSKENALKLESEKTREEMLSKKLPPRPLLVVRGQTMTSVVLLFKCADKQ